MILSTRVHLEEKEGLAVFCADLYNRMLFYFYLVEKPAAVH